MKSPRRIGYKTGSTPSISWMTSVLPNRTASSKAVEKFESWQGSKQSIQIGNASYDSENGKNNNNQNKN